MDRNSSDSDILDFVLRERSRALSEREWKFRLRGYGYAIRDSAEGRMVTAVMSGREICRLEAAPV